MNAIDVYDGNDSDVSLLNTETTQQNLRAEEHVRYARAHVSYINIMDNDANNSKSNVKEITDDLYFLPPSRDKEQINVLSLKNDEKLMMVPGMIENVGVEALLDTGASVSTISRELVNKLSLKIDKTSTKIQTADNKIIPAIGIVKNVKLKICNNTCKLDLVVMDNSYDIICGVNWFKKVAATIFFTEEGKTMLKFATKWYDVDMINEGMRVTGSVYEINVGEKVVSDDEVEGVEEPYDEDYWTFVPPDFRFKPSAELNNEQMKAFMTEIVPLAMSLVARNMKDLCGCKLPKVHIETTGEPVHILPYRRSEHQRKEEYRIIAEMKEAGLIRVSNSTWMQPIFTTAKGRLCMDSREINKQTPKRSWPVPLIQDLLRRVAKSRWFSKFDLKSGFWQLSLDEESSAKLGFATSEGKYEWTRLCFGLKNALFEFQKAMYTLLGDLNFIEIYVDDLILHASTFWEHIENIKIVLNRLNEAGLKINGLKTVFCAKRIKLLGHVIENGVIAMDEDKIRAIVERKPPKDVKGVQSWVGSANYYRPFIHDFARMAKPLFILMCDNVVFVWTTECQQAFDQIKQVFTTAPILRIADLGRMFLLYTDASEFAFGGILAQMDDIPMEYVVEYMSKLFKRSQLKWHITMKELYAIVYNLKYFRVYLQNVPFKVITDHKALIYLDSQKDLSNKLARIKVFMSQFDMEIVHRKGKLHANVDMLSRPVLVIRNREDANSNDLIFHNPKITQDENNKGLDAWQDDNLIYFLKYNKYTPGLSRRQVTRVTKEAQHFKLEKEKLWYKADSRSNEFREYPKENERVEIIEKAHLFGHFAAASTYNRLKSKYYWRRMMDDVVKVVGKCMVCLRNKKFRFQEHEAMALEYEGVGDTIHIDIISGLPETKEGFCKILTIVERITGNGMAEPLKTKTMTEVKGKLLLYFSIYGLPKKIISDAGREFVNEIIDGLLTSVGVAHKVTSSFNARTNGAGERFNQSLMEALRCHCEANPRNWPDGLIWVMWAYRTRVNPITGYSPYMLTYGREMNGFEDWTNKPDQEEEMKKRE
jgi:predicted aspartyl protease/transposase InsO family protein